MTVRLFGAFVFAVLSVLPLAGVARADPDDTAVRLTVSLRQLALVQTMRAATCFAMGGVDADRQAALALEQADTYETTLTGLRDGHDWLGLSPTRDPDDVAVIAATEAVWRAYRPAVYQIVSGDLHSVVMRQIMRDADQTVVSAEQLAGHFLETLEAADISPDRRAAAMLAARFQMLTQRALAETCFVLFDLGGAETRDRLTRTLEEADQTYALLTSGALDIVPAPSARVTRNMRTANLFWGKMRPTIDAVQDTQMPDADAVQKMLKLNQSVMKQLNQAVAGYIG